MEIITASSGIRMQIGVIGANHRSAGLDLRERFAKACEKRLSMHASSLLFPSHILLSTCNRTEIYFSAENLEQAYGSIMEAFKEDFPGFSRDLIYSAYGLDCFHHLGRVVSGLDSAVKAETEIQGQV